MIRPRHAKINFMFQIKLSNYAIRVLILSFPKIKSLFMLISANLKPNHEIRCTSKHLRREMAILDRIKKSQIA